MSRLFAGGSSQYLEATAVPVSTVPLTLAYWAYWTGNVFQAGSGLGIFDSSATNHWFALSTVGNGSAISSRGEARSGSASVAVATDTVTINVWAHYCAVFPSTTTRYALMNGGGKGSVGGTRAPASLDVTGLGRYCDSTPNGYFYGRIADAAIWSAALTDAEVLSLAAGLSPLLVRPQSLVFYAPLIRDEDRDIVGGVALTPTNTPTIAAHTRIYNPAPSILTLPVGGAPPAGAGIRNPLGGPMVLRNPLGVNL